MEYHGYTNSEVFITCVEHSLCKELKADQVVIMDNASFHKSSKVKSFIESAWGKLVYLSAYSPALNPIKHIWANLKRLIRVHLNREKIYRTQLMNQ